jgi:phage-related protein (TIGR01555 family)
MKRSKLKKILQETVRQERRRGKRVPKKVTVVEANKPTKPPFKVHDFTLARARALKKTRQLDSKPRINPFEPYQPPPGVVPAGHSLAMDEAMSGALTWAAQATISGMWSEGLTFLGYAYLSELSQRPEYRVISSVIATEMTRKWIKLEASEGDEEAEDKTDKIKELEDYLDRLNVRDVFYQLAEQDGFFGRTHLYLDTGDTDDRDELAQDLGDGRNDRSKMKVNPKNPLQRLAVIEPIWCYPQRYNSNDPLRPDWYNPEVWFCMSKEIHASRLLTFVGNKVPDILKPAYAFGGLSRSQIAKPYVDNWLTTRQSVNDLIHSFSVMVLMTDMSAMISSSNAALDGSDAGSTTGDAMFNRLDMFNSLRDNRGIFALNKDTEDFKNVTTPLSTLDSLQAQSQEHMASVSRIPLVKLLGVSPAGLNASSEGEIRAFYDTIHAFQEQFFRPGLSRVIDFCQLSLWGEVDPAITIRFEELWSIDALQEATIRKMDAETDDILVNGVGALASEEVRQRIAADVDAPYASLDVEDMPEPPAPEVDPATGEPLKGQNISLRGTTKKGEGPASQKAGKD